MVGSWKEMRAMKEQRMKGKGDTHKRDARKGIWKVVMQSLLSQSAHLGNQKSSQPVCVAAGGWGWGVGFVFARRFPAQFKANTRHNKKPRINIFAGSFLILCTLVIIEKGINPY